MRADRSGDPEVKRREPVGRKAFRNLRVQRDKRIKVVAEEPLGRRLVKTGALQSGENVWI